MLVKIASAGVAVVGIVSVAMVVWWAEHLIRLVEWGWQEVEDEPVARSGRG